MIISIMRNGEHRNVQDLDTTHPLIHEGIIRKCRDDYTHNVLFTSFILIFKIVYDIK